MGATNYIINYKNLTEKQMRERVVTDTEQMQYEEGCSYSGTWASKAYGINIINKKFNSTQEAEDYILDNNDKWDCVDAVLVQYKAGTDKQNEKIKLEKSKTVEIKNSIMDFHKNWTKKLKERNSKTISCSSCKTRFNKEQIRNSFCPQCNHSLLSATDTKKVDKIKEKAEKQELKVKSLIAKRGGKTVKTWVVGGWCSC